MITRPYNILLQRQGCHWDFENKFLDFPWFLLSDVTTKEETKKSKIELKHNS